MVIQLIFNYDQVSKEFSKTVPNLVIEEKIYNILLGTFQLQAIVSHIGCSPFRGNYKSFVKYDNIWYTTNNLKYSIGAKLECSTNDTGMIPYLLIYEKNVNDSLLISNIETDRSQLSKELHNIDDVLEKVDESYETERIADELVLLEEIYSDDSELNMEYKTTDLEKDNSDFVVTGSHRKDDIRCNPVQPSSSEIRSLDVAEMNKKSVLCEPGRQKEKLIACKETK